MHHHSDTLSLGTPEATSAARARGFNSVSVGKFFTLLEGLQDKHHFTSDRIYNVDETGVSTVPNRPSRIIAARGKKQVGVLSSAERGQLVTGEICMSASKEHVQPMFIFPRKRMKLELMEKARPGSIAEPHESGWMQSDGLNISLRIPTLPLRNLSSSSSMGTRPTPATCRSSRWLVNATWSCCVSLRTAATGCSRWTSRSLNR